jgi:alpha-methylacyl-CoA racemase
MRRDMTSTIALTGALHAIGCREGAPVANLVGDFGGGAMLLAFGVLCALTDARTSGHGKWWMRR